MAVQESTSKHIRIALADDNKEMLDIVIELLGPEFVLVGTFADGRAFVDAVTELKPEIGILDISMPIMNGIEAAVEVRRLGLETKIVFLTVNEDPDFVRAAFESGGIAYVVKRRMATDLNEALREACAGRRFISTGCALSEPA